MKNQKSQRNFVIEKPVGNREKSVRLSGCRFLVGSFILTIHVRLGMRQAVSNASKRRDKQETAGDRWAKEIKGTNEEDAERVAKRGFDKSKLCVLMASARRHEGR